MLVTTIVQSEQGLDLGQAMLQAARSLTALRVSPQTFGFDRRIDRAAYVTLSRLSDLGTARMSELASLLCLDISTVSRQVRALEDAELVVRTPDPDDRRASALAPTVGGQALVAQMKDAFSRLIDAALADWSDRDRRTLTGLLIRLADDLHPERASQLVADTIAPAQK